MPLTIDASATQFVYLDEVKSHANVPSSRDDAELEMIRCAAQDIVEGLVGPVLHRTVTELVSSSHGVVLLRHLPVLSVTSVTRDGVAATYSFDAASGAVYDVGRGDFAVIYVTGRTVVPDAIRLATLIIGGHLWKTQQGQSPSMLQGDEPVPQYGLGFSVPNRALDLLHPYLKPPGVA